MIYRSFTKFIGAIWRRETFAVFFIALCKLVYPDTIAQAQDNSAIENAIGTVAWRSGNTHFDGLQAELENYYLKLANLDLLETKSIILEKDIPYASIYFNDSFPYLYWTDAIDNLLCDLNSQVCKRDRVPLLDPEAGATDHVMGYEFSDLTQTRWSLSEGSKVNVPAVEIDLSVNWISYSIDSPASQTLRDGYESEALGCPVGLADGDDFQRSVLDVGFAQFRDMMRTNVPVGCPSWIMQKNAYWFAYAAKANRAYDNSESLAVDEKIQSALGRIDDLTKNGDSESAWAELDRVAQEVFANKSVVPNRVQLPVVTFAADSFVTARIERPSDFSSAVLWADSIGKLPLETRLAQLDPDRYLVSVFEATEDWYKELDATKGLLPFEDIAKRPIVSSSGGVGVREFKPSSSTWEFNALTRPPTNAENMKNYELVNFTSSTGTQYGPYVGSIVFLDWDFDKKNCLFEGNCDQSKFMILELDNVDLAQIADEKMRSRIVGVVEDLKGTKKFHALAVAAIATASANSWLINGIYPRAYRRSLDIDTAHNWYPDRWLALRDDTEAQVPGNPVTWNVSAQTKNEDNVQGIVRLIESQLDSNFIAPIRDIFVVSGGHLTRSEIAKLDVSDCNIYPACLVAKSPLNKSIVTVVGVMRDNDDKIVLFNEGDASGDSVSFTHSEFQIAAPAAGFVVPTKDPEFLTSVNGVSFAVPLVSGTIAALRSYTIDATHAIARLMACAVHYDSLRQKVLAGVLDVDCSLAVGYDQVSFVEDIYKARYAEYKELRRGRVLGIWQTDYLSPARELPLGGGIINGDVYYRPQLDKGKSTLFGVRAMGDSPDEIKITVLDAKEELDIELRGRIDSSLIMEFQPYGADGVPDGDSVCFELRSLRNYIPAVASVSNQWEEAKVPRCSHP